MKRQNRRPKPIHSGNERSRHPEVATLGGTASAEQPVAEDTSHWEIRAVRLNVRRPMGEAAFLGAFIGLACSVVPHARGLSTSTACVAVGGVLGVALRLVGGDRASRWMKRLAGWLTYV
jgi:hypothetical protein